LIALGKAPGWDALKNHFADKMFLLMQGVNIKDEENEKMIISIRKAQTTMRAYNDIFDFVDALVKQQSKEMENGN
jgi:hypothetical protein